MKVLIISHVSPFSSYGAATSIKNHIKCIEQNVDVETIYNENFPSRRDAYLSFKICPNYTFFSGGVFKRFIYKIRNWLISLSGLNTLDCSKYDLIHFNSLVLLRNTMDILLASKGSRPYIVFHVREVLDTDQLEPIDFQNLNEVDLFICIDSITEKKLLSIDNKFNSVIITNPIKVNSSVLNSPYNYLSEIILGKKVFAIIGKVTPDKGVDFVLRAFQSLSMEYFLLVIGDNQSNYARSLLKKYARANIISVGEINNLSESGIYKIIDVLIRAEEFFCVGRTSLEAIYSGINILQPCDQEEQDDNDLMKLCDGKLINYYIPRDSDSFISAISKIDFSSDNLYLGSNLTAYEKNVMKAYESIS